jgi:hypothetical protein
MIDAGNDRKFVQGCDCRVTTAQGLAVGVVRLQDRSRSLIVKLGAQTKNPRVKCLLPGRRTELIVCHAINMAMDGDLACTHSQFQGGCQEFCA